MIAEPDPTRDSLRRLFWQALAIRILAALVVHFGFSEETFAPDQTTYDGRGFLLAQHWAGEIWLPPQSILPSGPTGYFYIVAAVYFVFGRILLLPKLLNCLVGALSVPLVYDLTIRISGSRTAARRAAQFVKWFPSLVLWSALNIRDAWIVLLILLIARQALVLREQFQFGAFITLAASLLAIVQFRAYILLAVALPVLLSFAVQRTRNLGRNLLIGALASAVVIYADQAAGASRRLRFIDLEEIQQHRNWNTEGAASQFEAADISTPTKALVFLPKGLAYFLLAPFPWMLGSIRQVLAVPETLFLYWLIPWIARGIRALIRSRLREALMPLLITAGLTLGYALGEGNAGTAYRHRAQVLGFFLIFAAVGFDTRRVDTRMQA